MRLIEDKADYLTATISSFLPLFYLILLAVVCREEIRYLPRRRRKGTIETHSPKIKMKKNLRKIRWSVVRTLGLIAPLIIPLMLAACAPTSTTAEPAALESSLWPFWVYFAGVLVVVAGMLGVSYVLGQRHQELATNEPYESGMNPTGSARVRLSANFYMVAILFVIFDLEAAFIIAWAVAYREAGWLGYLGMLVFVVILAVALVYEWRLGVLDWGTRKLRSQIEPSARRQE
jgi:NADH-quinone oxidoreductase subunit A